MLAGCDRSATSASTLSTEKPAPVEESPSAKKPDTPPRTGSNSLPAERTGAERIIDSTFDDIKFEIEPGDPFDRSLLTPQIEDLFGRRIRIRGFMFPTLKKQGLTQFVLVRDNLECCFGPGAALFDCILVHMEPGHTAEFSIRPIAVEGTFSLEEVIGPDGNHLAIYRLDASKAGN